MAWDTVEYEPAAACVFSVVDLHDSCVYGVGYHYEEDICLEVWGVVVATLQYKNSCLTPLRLLLIIN